MTLRRSATIGLLPVAVVLGAGLVDATWGGHEDLAVVFALALALQIALFVRFRFGRQPTSLRPDLARWVDEHARATGEDPGLLTDRCVAAYRAGLVDGDRRGDP